jgi:hypothetical protein
MSEPVVRTKMVYNDKCPRHGQGFASINHYLQSNAWTTGSETNDTDYLAINNYNE